MSLYLQKLLFELHDLIAAAEADPERDGDYTTVVDVAAKARELIDQARADGVVDDRLRPTGRFAPGAPRPRDGGRS